MVCLNLCFNPSTRKKSTILVKLWFTFSVVSVGETDEYTVDRVKKKTGISQISSEHEEVQLT